MLRTDATVVGNVAAASHTNRSATPTIATILHPPRGTILRTRGARRDQQNAHPIRASHRGGAGTKLLEAALAWARAQQMDRVILWPSPRSVTLYERHGFVHGGDVMELALGSTR